MSFDHRAHLALAHEHLEAGGLQQAEQSLPTALRARAAAAGSADVFRHDLTLAWLHAIHDRWHPGQSLDQLLAAHPELADPSLVSVDRDAVPATRARR